jgi:Cft2 family RNA processing exonuclease
MGRMKLFNKHPIRYDYYGGRVHRRKRMTRKQLSSDSVRAILQPGEIVIPVKHAGRVARMLKRSKIKLPGL